MSMVLRSPTHQVRHVSQPPSTSTFQALAAGTEDLAALVGLFATDSVERYAIDYSRGYLSVAMAHCSVLGILGYVRAIVKIAMGTAACEKAAFPTGRQKALLLLLHFAKTIVVVNIIPRV